MAETWVDSALGKLRSANGRSGGARRLVVELLGEQDCCLSAQDIHDAVRARGSRVGIASVYRALDGMDAPELVQRVDLGDGVARFEPATRVAIIITTSCATTAARSSRSRTPVSRRRSSAWPTAAATASPRTTSSCAGHARIAATTMAEATPRRMRGSPRREAAWNGSSRKRHEPPSRKGHCWSTRARTTSAPVTASSRALSTSPAPSSNGASTRMPIRPSTTHTSSGSTSGSSSSARTESRRASRLQRFRSSGSRVQRTSWAASTPGTPPAFRSAPRPRSTRTFGREWVDRTRRVSA